MERDLRQLFGTDGIRGVANKDLTPEFVLNVGKSVVKFLNLNSKTDKKNGKKKNLKILIGKDTRPSGDFLETALAAGIMSSGCDVYSAGVLSTPGIALLSKILGMDGAIVISASHNPLEDNGIKIFKQNGAKLTNEEEEKLEDLILKNGNFNEDEVIGLDIGRLRKVENALEIYINHIIKDFCLNLDGLKIAVDCANGATSITVPKVLEMFGAKVMKYNTDINSGLINKNCGSTHPEFLQKIVKESGADLGFSYDGDGDRVIGCDRFSRILDGDVLMAFSAIEMKKNNMLKNNSIVTTIMANYGFEKAMINNGIKVYKTKVGDRYVLEKMLENDVIIGGEQSGHIIFRNYSDIGDGLLSTLIFLNFLLRSNVNPDEIYNVIEHYPQELRNLRVKDKNHIMQSEQLRQKIKEAEKLLHNEGKIVVRSSGTEPLIRVMVEARTIELVRDIQEELCAFINSLN